MDLTYCGFLTTIVRAWVKIITVNDMKQVEAKKCGF